MIIGDFGDRFYGSAFGIAITTSRKDWREERTDEKNSLETEMRQKADAPFCVIDDACQFLPLSPSLSLCPFFISPTIYLSVPFPSSAVHQNVVGRECNGLGANDRPARWSCNFLHWCRGSNARNKSDFPRGATRNRKKTGVEKAWEGGTTVRHRARRINRD